MRRHYNGADVAASTGGRGVRSSRSTDSTTDQPQEHRGERLVRPTPTAGGSSVEYNGRSADVTI